MKDWEAAYVAGIIDGEGTITLTRIHENEYRRPCITIASTDIELLNYLQTLIGGKLINKKNYKPNAHKDSYALVLKKKESVMNTLNLIIPYLRVNKKRDRAEWITKNYDSVTMRNEKYSPELLQKKLDFEEFFFQI